MASIRAYAVPVRNDLSDSLVQFNDVFPNTSQTTDLNPVGQTGYINPGYFVTNPVAGQNPVYEFPLGFGIPATDTGGGLKRLNNTGYIDGLAVWALDNLCGFDGGANDGLGLNAEQARSWAARVVCRAVKGQSLTATDLCACLVAISGINSGVVTTSYTNDLTAGGGGQIGAAGGSYKTTAQMVEEVIKILSGQVYRMLDNAVLADDPANDYTAVTHNPATLTGVAGGTTASGFLTAPNTNTTAAQAFPASLDFVPYRTYYYGAGILASAQEGQLAGFATHQLGAGSFAFEAAKLSDGQTDATYGGGSANGAVAAGTARGLQHTYAVTSISAANPAVVTFVGNHGFVVNDVIRLRGCVQAGTILTNGVYKVQAVGAANTCALKSVANVNINNTGGGSGTGAGGTFTLELDAPTAAVVTATDNVNIPSTGTTAYEFRAIVVYDNEGNVLSV